MSRHVRSSQLSQLRFCREPALGAALPMGSTFFRLNALALNLEAAPQTSQFTPSGAFYPTISTLNDDFSQGSGDGAIIDFNGIVFILASYFGEPVITTLGGGAYRWVFRTDGRRPNRPVSYEAHSGYSDYANKVKAWIFNNLNLGGGRADGFTVSAGGFGKPMLTGQMLGGVTNEVQTITITGSPTGGTFTLTFRGATTAPIPYNASAAAIEAALGLLPSIGEGNVVASGGALPGVGVPVTFVGDLAGENVPPMTATGSLTGGSSPAVVITQTTAGSDVVYDVPPVPAGAMIGDCYLDPSWATLGNSQLLYCYNSALTMPDRMNRVRPTNSSLSSDTVIDNPAQEATLAMTLGVNATLDSRLSKLRAGEREFIRQSWIGNEIGASGHDYSLQTDCAVLWTAIGADTDQDGVKVREVTGRIAIDPVANEALTITVQNGIGTLSPTI